MIDLTIAWYALGWVAAGMDYATTLRGYRRCSLALNFIFPPAAILVYGYILLPAWRCISPEYLWKKP